MYSEIKAKNIMTTRLVTLKPDDDIYLGLHALLSHQISGAPVVDDNGMFLGIFNEKSCMSVVLSDQFYGASNTTVSAFMFTDVKIIAMDTPLIDIAMLFRNEPLRRLPVLLNGRLVGQVSRRDVLRAVESTLKKECVKRKCKCRSVSPIPYYSALIDPLDHGSNQA